MRSRAASVSPEQLASNSKIHEVATSSPKNYKTRSHTTVIKDIFLSPALCLNKRLLLHYMSYHNTNTADTVLHNVITKRQGNISKPNNKPKIWWENRREIDHFWELSGRWGTRANERCVEWITRKTRKIEEKKLKGRGTDWIFNSRINWWAMVIGTSSKMAISFFPRKYS